MGVDGAVFQVDATAASCGLGLGAVLAACLVLHHVGAEQTDGVTEASVDVGVGTFAEDGAAVALGGSVVVEGGMAHVHAARMIVEGAAVFQGDVVVDLGAVIEGDIVELGGRELEQVDVAHVGVGTAAVARFGDVVRQHSAVKGDVARVVVDAAAVFRGGIVVDEGVVSLDGTGVGIHAAALIGFVE